MPTMNPDGYTEDLYENINFVNLNRDFPDPVQRKGKGLTASGKEQVRRTGAHQVCVLCAVKDNACRCSNTAVR